MNLFLMFWGYFFNTTSRVFNFFFAILRDGLFNRSNRKRRNVRTLRRAADETKLLSYIGADRNVMITGGMATTAVRERLMAQLAFQTQQFSVPVIVLHRGNRELEGRIAAISGAVICGRNQRNYDPFRELNAAAIADVLLDNMPATNAFSLNIPLAKIYIQGLAQFYLSCLGIRPSLNSLCDCTDVSSKGYFSIINALQNAQNRGRINQQTYNSIKAQLDAGQSQEANLYSYLCSALQNLASCVPPPRSSLSDAVYVSLRRSITRNGILCVDVGTVSDEAIFYNLFVNELTRCDADQLIRPYLILDGINIKSSSALQNLLEGQNAPMHCISCDNVYAVLNDGKPGSPLFNSLASGCGLHITLRQPSGAAATLWSEYYGTYQKQKRSLGFNNGSSVGHGTQLFPGHSQGMMVQYNDVDERVWRPDEFTRMSDQECICAMQCGGPIRFINTRITP